MLSPMRAAIARRMAHSKQTIPHFYVSTEIDVEALTGPLTATVIGAVARTLVSEPGFNAHWTDDGPVQHDAVNVGVAIAVPGGLMAPAILGCEQLSVEEIDAALRDLAERARRGRAKGAELTDGTFTVSNLGGHDVGAFAAIVNPPQVAILATGRAGVRPAVVDGELVARRRMTATLSVDHRALDGTDAGRFLDHFKDLMEAPAR